MSKLHWLFLALLPAASPVASFATDVQINLDFSMATVNPGQTFTYTGTLVNLDPTVVYLNSCDVNLSGISLVGDCSDFLLNPDWPSLDADQTSDSFDLFTVTASLPFLDPLGIQNGSFDVLGGATSMDEDVLASADFSVNVIDAAPEPATSLPMLLACALIFTRSCRTRARVPPGRWRIGGKALACTHFTRRF